jgi:tetratricopeptide (TPR) repeat protein
VRSWHSFFYLLPMGRGEEAQREAERVLQENPLEQMAQASLAAVLSQLGKEQEAIAAYRRACAIDPQFWWGWCHLGLIHAVHGRNVEAWQCAEKAAGGHGSPYHLALSAGTLMNDGEAGRAEELLAKLQAHPCGGQEGMACYHLIRGEFDAAVECARKAVDDRIQSLIPLVVRQHEPLLRKSPGWPALLKKLNLPEKEIR